MEYHSYCGAFVLTIFPAVCHQYQAGSMTAVGIVDMFITYSEQHCLINRPSSMYSPFHPSGMENTWNLVCLVGNERHELIKT